MPHKHNRSQNSWKYIAAALLAAPSVSLAMDMGQRKPPLPLPAALAPATGGATRLFSWYDTPGLSHLPEAAPTWNGGPAITNPPSMSVLPFLMTTPNVDTSGTGFSNLQLEPLRALKVIAPVTVPWNTLASNGTTYDVKSLFGELPPASIDADPAALAALIRQVDWTRAAARETKPYDSWIGSSDSNQPTRISYTYVGPRSYVDYAYAQEAIPWHAAGNLDIPKPSPLFMLPMWAAANLTDNASGSTLLQKSWWAGNQSLAPDEAQLVSRNLGESEDAHKPEMVAGVDVFHLLDTGLSGITRIRHSDQLQPWINQEDVQNIFSRSGHTLIAAEPEYHTIYSEQPPASSTAEGQLWASPDVFLADATGQMPETLYILPAGDDRSQESLPMLSAIESYSIGTTELTTAPGGMPHLARNLREPRWVVASQHTPLAEIGGTRTGFGMPDPGSLALLALAGILRTRSRKRPA